jgi:hypothetical protein
MKKLDAHALKNLERLQAITKRYSPKIKNELKAAGLESDAALIESLAKYYPALMRLGRR